MKVCRRKRNGLAQCALLIGSALILAACLIAPPTSSGEAGPPRPQSTSAPTASDSGENGVDADAPSLLAEAYKGAFTGTVVTIIGSFTDQDEQKFNATLAPFEAATGIDIQYAGSKEFEATITTRIEGGDAPDIADFPQPGLLRRFAAQNQVVDVSSFIPLSKLRAQYIEAWIDMSTMPDAQGEPLIAGVWERFNGKSLVWYPKKAFDQAGYRVPATWDELQTLMAQMVADGTTPWCIGIESGVATGWPATDWVEDFMLRTTSLENYDRWVAGSLKFTSPEVKQAVSTLSEIWLNKQYVYGGPQAIATTAFGAAPAPMFENPPRCWLHKQANFITSFFPAGVQPLVDYDVFYLPPIDERYGKPFLVAGDILAMFNDRPEVRATMELFTSAEHLRGWLASGGTLSPHKDVDLSWYGSDLERAIAKLASEATSVRFDASDLMPGEVGAGSFWQGMTNYVKGEADLDATLQAIDAAWPE